MTKHLLGFSSILLLLVGCYDVVETDIIEIKEKVYISGFISPESDSLTITISKTLPALGLEFELNVPDDNISQFVIEDANVRILDSSGNAITLPFQQSTLTYSESASEFSVLPGETYNLEVLIKDILYTSYCNIPPNNITAIQEQIDQRANDFGVEEYELNLSFNDILNRDNFYFIGAFLDVEDEFSFSNNIFFDLEAYQTDVLGDGATISASADFFPAIDFEDENFPILEQDLVLQVINAEESLYQLLRTRYLNDFNQDNPFIELAIEPNNINGDGGTGLFAGYRYFEKRIPLNE